MDDGPIYEILGPGSAPGLTRVKNEWGMEQEVEDMYQPKSFRDGKPGQKVKGQYLPMTDEEVEGLLFFNRDPDVLGTGDSLPEAKVNIQNAAKHGKVQVVKEKAKPSLGEIEELLRSATTL